MWECISNPWNLSEKVNHRRSVLDGEGELFNLVKGPTGGDNVALKKFSGIWREETCSPSVRRRITKTQKKKRHLRKESARQG